MIISSGSICYCSGYKCIGAEIPGFIKLGPSGKLTIYSKYAWDGPSGPTFDTRDFMRGSLAHDALYQLMREGKLNISRRDTVDRFLIALCKEDGMSDIRCAWVYYAVKDFAIHAAERRDRERYYAGFDSSMK